jgi:BASS family bile acid:Na+ symporter
MEAYSYIDVLINVVLAIIMLGIGLSLTLGDFRNIFLHPRSLFTALGIQVFIVPAIAFTIARMSPLNDEMRVGLIIVSVCASGASSNLITHLFKGNVALAISMTTINSFITLLSVPLIVNLALIVFLGKQQQIVLPFWETVLQIFIVTIIPAAIGVFIRHYKERIAKALEQPLKYILPLMLATVFSIKIFLSEGHGGTGISIDEALFIFTPMIILNFFAMAAGFFGGRLMHIPFRDQFTISIEVGLHNTALALLISGSILQNNNMEKPAVVYAMFSFFSAILFVLLIKWLFGRKEKLA